MPRGVAAYTMHQCWRRFEHWGLVPNMDERLHLYVYYATIGVGYDETRESTGGPLAAGTHDDKRDGIKSSDGRS